MDAWWYRIVAGTLRRTKYRIVARKLQRTDSHTFVCLSVPLRYDISRLSAWLTVSLCSLFILSNHLGMDAWWYCIVAGTLRRTKDILAIEDYKANRKQSSTCNQRLQGHYNAVVYLQSKITRPIGCSRLLYLQWDSKFIWKIWVSSI